MTSQKTASKDSKPKLAGFHDDLKALRQGLEAFASALPQELKPQFDGSELTVKNLRIRVGDGSATTKAMQDEKFELAGKGIELYYIFPWEVLRLPQLLSHFRSKLELDSRKFAAKRLQGELIPNKEADEFVALYHIQGSVGAPHKISYGLRVKATGELLAVQQYCKSRWTLKKLEENAGVWEGLRLAIKSDVQIYGATSRLQKLFLKAHQPEELISYVNWSHSMGDYKLTQGFEKTFSSQDSFMWALVAEPKAVEIVDKNGVKRLPDLTLVKKLPYLNPARIAGAFGKGVGQTFYGGKLGSRKELLAQGNELYHNDLILEAIGYRKIDTLGQLRWSKKLSGDSVEAGT